jgi:acetoacetyl-CoA synthetase
VTDSLVVGAELADGIELTGQLTAAIKAAIGTQASPRHVSDDVVAVAALPHTRTGKKLEIPVKRLIQGHPIDRVAGRQDR